METIILSGKSKKSIQLIVELAKQLGISVNKNPNKETIDEVLNSISKLKERKIVKEIANGLNEVKLSKLGKNKLQSLNDLLNE